MESNDAAGAFEAFKKAVSLDGTNVNSIRNLGILYAMCKVEAGVHQMHECLVQLDASAAKAFIKKATELLKR
jgi:cytochrome c-type biogenesis protein CcmH/NrfG